MTIRLILTIFILTLKPALATPHISHFGNAKYPTDFKHFDYANPNAKKGGTIKFATVGSFDSLNPFILTGNSANGLNYTYDTLLTKSLDELSTYYGLLAKDINITPQDKSVTFTLNENATWRDGTNITSHDILFSYQTLKEKGHPEYRIQLKNVKSAEIITKHKIRFYLPSIKNKDLIFVIGTLPIISKEYYSKHDFSKTSLEPFLGSGPYYVSKAEASKYITYTRNPDYWGRELPVNKGRYNFNKIKYKYYRDSTIAVMALKAGEYDIRNENIAKNWANEYDLNEVNQGLIVKENIKHQIPTGMQAFVLNNRLKKFQNQHFRKALNLAFDFEWTNMNLFFSAYNRTESFFSNSLFSAPNSITKGEQDFAQHLQIQDLDFKKLNNLTNPKTSGNGNNRTHLLEASRLLEAAGYYLEGMKLHDPNTRQPITLEFIIVSPSFQRVILPYIKNLKKLGIDARIKLVDFSIYQKRLENFDFEITIHVFGGTMIPGAEQYSYWHSASATQNGSSNLAGISNPDIDKIVNAIGNAKSLEELQTLTYLLDRLLISNNYIIPQWNINSFRLIYWNKFAKPSYNPPYGLALDYWWTNQI